MKQSVALRAWRGGWVAGLLACGAAGLFAAAITDLDESALASPALDPAAVSGPAARTGAQGLRRAERTALPDASTGNKNLDLLLDMQGKPAGPERQISPRTNSTTPAATAALATMPPQAVELPVGVPNTARPAAHPFDGMGKLDGGKDGSAQPSEQVTERREWTGRPAGGGVDLGVSDSGRRSDADRAAYADDSLLRNLPRELVALLREHRYWLLGALGVLALVVAMLKGYSRRI